MKLLFLTMVKISSLNDRGIYTDLLRKFRDEGHDVYIVSPSERREKLKTSLKKEQGVAILNIRTFNLQKTNIIEKGVGTLAMEYQYLNGIKKFFSDVKFDMVLYSTPPITFSKVISFVKKRDNAYAYLLLKDIFPQNAIDMKMMKQNGALHKMFLKKEKRLYAVSDTIGCMSEANIRFLTQHNPEINPKKLEVSPNTIIPVEQHYSEQEKLAVRAKYDLPAGKKIFLYGGNLGIPQGLDFLLETIAALKEPKAFVLIIGSGTEYNRMQKWFEKEQPENARLLKAIPKADYDLLVGACDAGMIFLHKNFTIPNFPSRLLSYLEMKMPVIAATDSSTDIGEVLEKANCGYWIHSGDIQKMLQAITKMCQDEANFNLMKENAWQLLQQEYTVERSYQLITEKITDV